MPNRRLGSKIVLILLATWMFGGAPTYAKPLWWILGGALATVAGVSTLVAAPVGAALVGLQATMFKIGADEEKEKGASQALQPGYGGCTTSLCRDGGLSCTAATGILDSEPVPIPLTPEVLDDPRVMALVVDVNRVIEDANLLSRTATSGRLGMRERNLASLADSLDRTADSLDGLGMDTTVSQEDLMDFQAQVRETGLPALEVETFLRAGLNPAEIDAVAEVLVSPRLKLAAPAVSLSRVLRDHAQTLRSPCSCCA